MRVLLRFSFHTASVMFLLGTLGANNAASQTDPTPTIQAYEASPCALSMVWQADGDSAGDFFGFSVDGGKDFNGDGYPDAVVGAMLADRVYAYYRNWLTGEFSRGYNRGGNSGSDFGRCVKFLGVPDNYMHGECNVLAGASGHSGAGNDSCGAVMDWNGNLDFSWIGGAKGDKLGYSVADLGVDLDGDGLNEIIAGAPEAMGVGGAPKAGYALLLSPGGNAELHRFSRGLASERFGHSVASLGDINDDGEVEIAIGAPLASEQDTPPAIGMVFIYRASGPMTRVIFGENTGDYFGNSVANAGDVDNDGFPDIIIGAYRADVDGKSDCGACYVFSGRTNAQLAVHAGWASNTNFGYAVAGVGDIDNDGYDDYIVGAHRDDADSKTDAGAAYVYSGHYHNILWMIVGAQPDDLFGCSVAPMGDFTLDGRPDFLVGAFSTNPGGRIEAGSAYLFGCTCDCAFNGDPAHDGVTNVLDVVGTVSDAFRGDPTEQGNSCRYCDSDVDCSGACDVRDVVRMVNVAFRGADKTTEFCNGCL